MRPILILPALLILGCSDRTVVPATAIVAGETDASGGSNPTAAQLNAATRPATGSTTVPATTQDAGVTLLPTTSMMIRGNRFILEIADEVPEQTQGLMHRRSMPADHGMIFVFPEEEPRGFWMKNTRIPLDIAYLDSKGVVVNVLTMFPFDENSYFSVKPAQYAIELNAGTAKKIGLQIGDRLDLPADIIPAH